MHLQGRDEAIAIAFDCHSQASEAPDISPDTGMQRLVINLGNNYGKACDNTTTEILADAFRKVLTSKMNMFPLINLLPEDILPAVMDLIQNHGFRQN